ncbi:S26 family signal peptidase [Streptomyces tailanensis]|uniref:S26 family signal peptidase n=1 Tax=Streptomyces tailanensis TaxID=2569858 RepID=UPI001FE94DFF|nr:S26 family signal peptidase [Streptomyces tailanensis]
MSRSDLAPWLRAHRARIRRARRTRRAQVLALALLSGASLTTSLRAHADWATAAGCAALTGIGGTTFVLWLSRTWAVVTVCGPSMEPAYRDGDRVLVRRSPTLRRGQVVVVEQGAGRYAGQRRPLSAVAGAVAVADRAWLIKRVAAVPGDPVPPEAGPALAELAGSRVPEGALVLFGDNTAVSVDSRTLGFFPHNRILGVVVRPLPAPRRP